MAANTAANTVNTANTKREEPEPLRSDRAARKSFGATRDTSQRVAPIHALYFSSTPK